MNYVAAANVWVDVEGFPTDLLSREGSCISIFLEMPLTSKHWPCSVRQSGGESLSRFLKRETCLTLHGLPGKLGYPVSQPWINLMFAAFKCPLWRDFALPLVLWRHKHLPGDELQL